MGDGELRIAEHRLLNSSEDAFVGSWNAGTTRWRSIFNYPTAGTPIVGRHIISATLNLYEKWSHTCSPRQFLVYSMGSPATSATTWNNQPAWSQLIASQTVAKGYSSQGLGGPSDCPAGPVPMPVTTTTQAAASTGAVMTLGLKATSETDSTYWKRFDNNPTLSVTYSGYAYVGPRSTSPASACVLGSGRPYINSKTPQLKAVIHDPEGASVKAEFEWYHSGSVKIGGYTTATVNPGSTLTGTVPSGAFAENGSYGWRVRGQDPFAWGSWSSFCEFTIDTTAPATAPTVGSTDYPTGTDVWAGGANTPGGFTFGAAGVSDVAAYLYGLDTNPPTTAVTAPTLGGPATATVTPTSDGPHTLYARSRDRAGNLSPITAYTFNVGGGAVTGPKAGDISTGTVALEGIGRSQATGVTYQWRRGDTDTWATIPAGDVTVADGGGAVTWPVPTSGGGAFPKLNWNLAQTVNDAEPGPDASDGPLQVQAVFGGGTPGTSSPVVFNLDRTRASAASAEVGPGSVNLSTGNLTVADTDVSVDSYGSDLSLSRTYSSRRPGGVDPMFGPGWVSNASVDSADAPYTGLTVNGSLVQAGLPDGDSIGFTRKATTATGATFTPELGAEDLTLTYTISGDSYTLKDLDGTVVTFTRPSGTPAGQYVPTTVAMPGSGQTTTVSWQSTTVDGVTVTRPTRMLAPVPAGVTCGTTIATLTKGCRAVNFTYATVTSATGTSEGQWGNYAGRLVYVLFTAWNPQTGAMQTVTLSQYAYDNTGRLRAAWDPRLDHSGGQHLADTYTYDSDGVLAQLRPAGQEPWQLSYTTVPGDSGKGRLHQVTRTALAAGTATNTVVYQVPTTGAGAPHDLSGTRTSRWGQTEPPVAATAVFGPNQIPTGDQAAGTMPSSYERAAVSYLDANGRIVNTVTPGGYTTATWYDRYGNTVRSLTAGNLHRALDASGGDSPADEAQLAEKLSTVNVYSLDGQQLRETFGPEHDVTLPDGSMVRGRTHTVTTYDQGAPVGEPYQLPTTETTSVAYTSGGVVVDVDGRTTATAYDWTLRQPTTVTVDPGGLALTTRTSYDTVTGLVTSTTAPAGGAVDTTPSTRKTIYYRAGAGSGYAECDNRPEWANLACRVQPGGQPASGPELPVTVTTYDMFNQPVTEVEKTSAGVLRTTTTAYDTAARVYQVSVTAAAGLGEPVPTRRNVYEPTTGKLVRAQTIGSGGPSPRRPSAATTRWAAKPPTPTPTATPPPPATT